MDIAALVGRHQRFAPHARSEMGNDDGNGWKASGHGGQRERVAKTKVEGGGKPKLLSYAYRQDAAVHEHRSLVLRCRGKDLSHPLVVQLIRVHGRKEANAL